MAHVALYRKWRPLTFEDVVEQRHVVTTLKNSIKNNTINHAYLFCGTRGTGKTTLAKIFARAINCTDSVDGSPCNQCPTCRGILDGSIIDVIEIDAASNNGVDDVREIKEAVMYVPAVARYKVYIIDEVHMLSTGAFNALLKTLEEPPQNVVFILATTEPHKLPATILSRCQRFDFKRISRRGLEERLRIISEDCNIQADNSALQLIARLSEGGMRDAISLLDQCIALGKGSITRQDVADIAGLSAAETVSVLAKAIVDQDARRAIQAIHEAMQEGSDIQPLCNQLIDWFRNVMLLKTGGEAANLIELSEEELQPLTEAADQVSFERIVSIIKELSETEGRLKWSENQRILMEVSAVKLCSCLMTGGQVPDERLAFLESRIQQLESRLIQAGEKPMPASAEPHGDKTPRSSKTSQPKQPEEESEIKRPVSEQKAEHSGKELKQWPNVIEYIRSAGKMKVYAYLLDTRCLVADESTVLVVVSADKKPVLNRNEHLEIIKDALSKAAGLNVHVKIVDEKEAGRVNPAAENPDPTLEKIKQFASENNIPLNIVE